VPDRTALEEGGDRRWGRVIAHDVLECGAHLHQGAPLAFGWYVPHDDIDAAALIPVEGRTFCPYKGLASYYDIGARSRAAWSYPEAWPEAAAVSDWVPFEPDIVDVYLDGGKLVLEPGQTVVPHGIDRGLDPDEARQRRGTVDR